MNLLFLGSGSFGIPILRTLHRLRGHRVQVGTVPDAPGSRGSKLHPTPVRAVATELGLKCHEVATLKHPEGLRLLQESESQLVIVCDFRLMLPDRFLAGAVRHCYNLHPSMLPRYRGAAPVARTVLAGDLQHGVSLYRMVRALDAGPVVARVACPILQKQPRATLEPLLAEACGALLETHLEALEHGAVDLEQQEEREVTYAPRLQKEEGIIQWHEPPDKIHDRVLAMWPWPRTSTSWVPPGGGAAESLLVLEVDPLQGSNPVLAPGTVRSTAGGKVIVACGPQGCGSVALLRLQRPGKTVLASGDFLRGSKLAPGHRLGPTPAEGTP